MSHKLTNRQYAVNTPDSLSRTPAGDAFSALVVCVFQLNGALSEAGDGLAKPSGQTSARWQVMACVEENAAPVAQIARALGHARQSVQRVADLLVEEQLAAYEDNPFHLRAKLLQLTARGRTTLRRIQSAQKKWANWVGAEIGEAELQKAIAILQRVLQSIQGAPVDG